LGGWSVGFGGEDREGLECTGWKLIIRGKGGRLVGMDGLDWERQA